MELSNGSYVVSSPYWDNGASSMAGAVTWCSGSAGCSGAVTSDNSVMGTTAYGGAYQTFAYDSVNDQLVVGRPYDHRATLFKMGLFAPAIADFAPIGGSAGTRVLISGSAFTGATAVMFNGTSASDFKIVSATSLTATVPILVTTGPISVTTPGGIATSNFNFVVFKDAVHLPLIRR